MVRRTQPKKQSVPPTLSSQRAIELLRQPLTRVHVVENLPYGNPEIIKWENTTTNIVDAAFGKPDGEMHPNTSEFTYCDSGEPSYSNMEEHEIQRHHQLRIRRRKSLLESFIEQLELLSPVAVPSASFAVTHAPQTQLL